MNWGVKIFASLLFFIFLAVGTGIYMVSKNKDTLIDVDYYEDGIHYDSTYIKKTNVQTWRAEPKILIHAAHLEITFTEKQNEGIVQLQRTSDASLDQEINFSTEGNAIQIPTQQLSRGQWKLRIQWEHQQIPLLFEKNIFIP